MSSSVGSSPSGVIVDGLLEVFSADGTRIVSTSGDLPSENGTVRLWVAVPYAQRYHQKQELEDAEPKAARVLDIVTATAPQQDGALDLRTVAANIRTDSAIDETVRHVAINLLKRPGEQIRLKANEVIHNLKKRLIFAADIRDALQLDPWPEPEVRAAAVRIACPRCG